MDSFIPNKLKERVKVWRENNYQCDNSIISEIFDYNLIQSERGDKTLRFLRIAQFEALETYWYLRLVEKTPHIFDLHKRLYNEPNDLLNALRIKIPQYDLIKLLSGGGIEKLFDEIKNNDDFVKKHKLEAVRESLTLDYPSYILALAMGSGKTVLIGSIIVTEFAMSLEYGGNFVKNALVFAPGKTILGALKEISDIPFDKILPPRLYKQFMSSVQITYTKDKQSDLPIIGGSNYNIIITNTEKIRIQKQTGKTKQSNLEHYLISNGKIEKFKEQEDVVNLRLQKLASLPNLAVFSDEAHHTYGQSLDSELKKVRKTVDYLAENTNLIVVVNTTGTPYYKKQMLKDVVYWYGLSQGIKDGILKEVNGSIFSYDDISSEEFVKMILEDFFKKYKDVTLFDGTKAKLAIYFPQTDEVKKIKPVVEKKVLELGLDPSIVLEVNNKSNDEIKDLFNNRINDSHNPYRVYLLVNMGTEGWNCPSLFATALARKLRTSNNFVLQAASRCLRQIPNNSQKARIYLSRDNVKILDKQLEETFRETLQDLDGTKQDNKEATLILKKTELPPLIIKQKIKKIIIDASIERSLKIIKPHTDKKVSLKTVYNVKDVGGRRGALIETDAENQTLYEDLIDIYEVAVELSSVYRLELSNIYEILVSIYPKREIPLFDVIELKKQIEEQTKIYKITEEEVEKALALVKLGGFDKEEIDGKTVYTTPILYHKDKEDLLLKCETFMDVNKNDFSFHYSPYKMDSNTEKDFFERILVIINEKPEDIDEMFFMGGITDPKKTDFLFEYQDKNGKYRNYTPDFLIRMKNGKNLIVEIKGEVFKDETKVMAMKEVENLNPDTFKYEILFTTNEKEIGFENIQKVKQLLIERE